MLVAVLGVAEGEAAVDLQGLAAFVSAVGLDECVVDALGFEPGEQEVPELVGADGVGEPGGLGVAGDRACATLSNTVTGPGRITCAEIKYSHASLNNNVGESCSIARANRNSSNSLNSNDVGTRHPRYRATSRR